jgi:RHS repeat-associated protein
VDNPLQFAGQYRDTESGLMYMQARYYDAVTGQFMTRDPMLPKTKEAYSYANGDPLNETDFTGMGFWGTLIAAVIATAVIVAIGIGMAFIIGALLAVGTWAAFGTSLLVFAIGSEVAGIFFLAAIDLWNEAFPPPS